MREKAIIKHRGEKKQSVNYRITCHRSNAKKSEISETNPTM